MFYNALARKGKLGGNASGVGTTVETSGEDAVEESKTTTISTIEEDMASVVAMHNCMNEATWRRVLQWEEVLHPSTISKTSSGGTEHATTSTAAATAEGAEASAAGAERAVVVGPALSRFEGRPTDLSPKAYLKHYLLGYPLPFDRHDWIVTRTQPDGSTTDVRYVIDYYHDDASASGEAGSGYPLLDGDVGPKGQVRSLLVDVRPAVDSVHAVWGRVVGMPLARRGCASLMECVLAGGGDCNNSGVKKSEFEPLPLFPSESLARGVDESKLVWKNIQQDALRKKGVGAMDDDKIQHSSSSSSGTKEQTSVDKDVKQQPTISQSDAMKFASTYSQIFSTCHESKKALQNCQSEEECEQAMVGMTVCAGQYMCPLQHTSLLDSLKMSNVQTASKEEETASEVQISTALDILSECVANYDARASVAKKTYPELFDKVSKGWK